jgi:hypothetical protein
MGTHLLTDVALKIYDTFASGPRRRWLAERLGEWRYDRVSRPHHPPREQSEVNAAGELPSGEPVPDSERTIHTLPEICFTLAAIHDAYRGVIGRAMNVEIEPFVERDGALWKSLAPYYGLRVAFETRCGTSTPTEGNEWARRRKNEDGEVWHEWDAERLGQLNALLALAISAAATANVVAGDDGKESAADPAADRNASQGEPIEAGDADQPIPPGGAISGESTEIRQSTESGGYLGGSALADALGVPPKKRNAFAKALERKRPGLGNGFKEVANPASNEPKYLYAVDNNLVKTTASKYAVKTTL